MTSHATTKFQVALNSITKAERSNDACWLLRTVKTLDARVLASSAAEESMSVSSDWRGEMSTMDGSALKTYVSVQVEESQK